MIKENDYQYEYDTLEMTNNVNGLQIQCISHEKLPFNWKEFDEINIYECSCLDEITKNICEFCIKSCHVSCDQERMNSKKKSLEKDFVCGCAKHDHCMNKNNKSKEFSVEDYYDCLNNELFILSGNSLILEKDGSPICLYCLHSHKEDTNLEKDSNKINFDKIKDIEKIEEFRCACKHNQKFRGTIKGRTEDNYEKILGIIFNNEKYFNSYVSNMMMDLKAIKSETAEFSQENLKKSFTKNIYNFCDLLEYVEEKCSTNYNPNFYELRCYNEEVKIEDIFDQKLTVKLFGLSDICLDVQFIKGYYQILHFLLNFIYLPKFRIINSNMLRFSLFNSSPLHRILLTRNAEKEFQDNSLDYKDFKNLIKNVFMYLIKYLMIKPEQVKSILFEYLRFVEFHLCFSLKESEIEEYAKNLERISDQIEKLSNEKTDEIKIKIFYQKLLLIICQKFNDIKFINYYLESGEPSGTGNQNSDKKMFFEHKNSLPKNFPFYTYNDDDILIDLFDLSVTKVDNYIENLQYAFDSNQNIFTQAFKTILLSENPKTLIKTIFENEYQNLADKIHVVNYYKDKNEFFNSDWIKMNVDDYLAILNSFLNTLHDDLQEALNLTTKDKKFIRQIFLFKENYLEMLFDILNNSDKLKNFAKNEDLFYKMIEKVYTVLAKILEENSFLITLIFIEKTVFLINKYEFSHNIFFLLLQHLEYQNFKLNCKYYIGIYKTYFERNYNRLENSLNTKLKFLAENYSIISNVWKMSSEHHDEIDNKNKLIEIIKMFMIYAKEAHENIIEAINPANNINIQKNVLELLFNNITFFYKLINSLSSEFFYLIYDEINIEFIESLLHNIKSIKPELRMELTDIYIKYYYRCFYKVIPNIECYKFFKTEKFDPLNVNPNFILNNLNYSHLFQEKTNYILYNLTKFPAIYETFQKDYFKYPKNSIEYFIKIALIPSKEYLQYLVYFTHQVDNSIKYKIYEVIYLFLENLKILINELDKSKLIAEEFDKTPEKFFKNDNQPFSSFFTNILFSLDKFTKKMKNKEFNLLDAEKLIENFKNFTDYFRDEVYQHDNDISNAKKNKIKYRQRGDEQFQDLIKNFIDEYLKRKQNINENNLFKLLSKNNPTITKGCKNLVAFLINRFENMTDKCYKLETAMYLEEKKNTELKEEQTKKHNEEKIVNPTEVQVVNLIPSEDQVVNLVSPEDQEFNMIPPEEQLINLIPPEVQVVNQIPEEQRQIDAPVEIEVDTNRQIEENSPDELDLEELNNIMNKNNQEYENSKNKHFNINQNKDDNVVYKTFESQADKFKERFNCITLKNMFYLPNLYYYTYLINELFDCNPVLFYQHLNEANLIKHIQLTFGFHFSIFYQMTLIEYNSYYSNHNNIFLKFFKNSLNLYTKFSVKENGSFVYLLTKSCVFDETIITELKDLRIENLICIYFCNFINNLEFFLIKKKWLIFRNKEIEHKKIFSKNLLNSVFTLCGEFVKFSPLSLFQGKISQSNEDKTNKKTDSKQTSAANQEKNSNIPEFQNFLEKAKMIFKEMQDKDSDCLFYYKDFILSFVNFLETYSNSLANKNIEIMKTSSVLTLIIFCYRYLCSAYLSISIDSDSFDTTHNQLLNKLRSDEELAEKFFNDYFFNIFSKLYLILLKNQTNSENKNVILNMINHSKTDFSKNTQEELKKNKNFILQKEVYLFIQNFLNRVELNYEEETTSNEGVSLNISIFEKSEFFESIKNRTANKKIHTKKAKDVIVEYFVIHPHGLYVDIKNDISHFMEMAPYDKEAEKYVFLIRYYYYFAAILNIRKDLEVKNKVIGFLVKIDLKYIEYFSLFVVILNNLLLLFSLYLNLSITNPELPDTNIIVSPLYLYVFYLTLFHILILSIFISLGLYLEKTKYLYYQKLSEGRYKKNESENEPSYFSLFFNKSLITLIYILITGLVAISKRELNFLFSLQLFYVCYFVETMKTVFMSIKLKYVQFMSAGILILIITFFFSVISNILFRSDFYNDDINQNVCDSASRCFFTLLSNGIRSGGGLGFPIVSYTDPQYWTQFFFEWLFYFFIILVMLNAINGIIVDTFQSLREENNNKTLYFNEYCYICNLTRSKFETNGIVYKDHLKSEHNVIAYLQYIYLLKKKNIEDMKLQEYDVYKKLNKGLITFFPKSMAESLNI